MQYDPKGLFRAAGTIPSKDIWSPAEYADGHTTLRRGVPRLLAHHRRNRVGATYKSCAAPAQALDHDLSRVGSVRPRKAVPLVGPATCDARHLKQQRVVAGARARRAQAMSPRHVIPGDGSSKGPPVVVRTLARTLA